MTPFREKFTTFLPLDGSSADAITGDEVKTHGIGTVQLAVDDQILERKNVRYKPNIVTGLISSRLLEKQGFTITPRPMEDGTSLFE